MAFCDRDGRLGDSEPRIAAHSCYGFAPMSDFHSQLAGVVNSFVAQVSALAREAAIQTLGNALRGSASVLAERPARATAQPRIAAAAPARRALPKGAKRPAEELADLQATLLEYIKAHPGQRVEQIKQALGASTKDLALPIRKLIAGGAVRSEGAKRATAYFAGKGKKA